MYSDFLVGISYLLRREDRVRLLRLALSLEDGGTIDFARVFFELSPFLPVDEKRKYGEESLTSGNCSLRDLLFLSSFFLYLPREDATKRIRSCIESLRQTLHTPDSGKTLRLGFTEFIMQQGLASIVEYETDSISVIANLAEQDELLGEAAKCFKGFPLWLNRIRVAQASKLYSQALGTSGARRLELLAEARKKTLTSIKPFEKLNDYHSLFAVFRLLFLIDFRKLLLMSAKDRQVSSLLKRGRRYAELSSKAVEAFGDPAKLAGAYTNTAIALKLQAQHEEKMAKRRHMYELARELHLKAASIARNVSKETVPLHLYNAGCTLVELSLFEPNVVKLNELLETASREMDEVVALSSSSSQAVFRFTAIIVKLICMQELADINPASLTGDFLSEVDRLGKELEGLVSRIYDPQLLVSGHLNLSRYYLKLLRVTARDQKELMQKAESNAFKAYQAAEVFPSNESIRRVLPNLAEVLMVKGILDHSLYTLEQASNIIDRTRLMLAGKGDPELLRTHSVAAEIHLVKYGYTGEQRELKKAISCLSDSSIAYTRNGYLQFAGEDLFRLATVYLLIQEDGKAEKALDKAARLFKKSGQVEPAFRHESLKFSTICEATKKLVEAQSTFKKGDKSEARKLAEQAEKQMVQANARWREVWLIRGLKEMILGNLDEAKKNLLRVVEESLDVVDDKNPASTGYTAKRLVGFIDEKVKVDEKRIPPTVIDLPLRTEAIVAADKLNRLSKELSSVTSMGTREERQEMNVEEIRKMVRRIIGVEGKKQKKENEKGR